MRTIVSTIGVPAYGISRYLDEIIQPTLHKNNKQNSKFKIIWFKANDWKIEPT